MKLPIKLPKGLTKLAGKVVRKFRKSSPEICIVVGVVAGGAALVMTGVETWKGKDKLSKDIETIKTIKANEPVKTETSLVPPLSKEEQKKELSKAYLILIKDGGKMFWKPIVLGAASVGFIWGGRTILRKDLSSVTAAYVVLKKQYDELVKNVRANVDEEKAQEILYGAKEVETIDAETGEIQKKIVTNGVREISPYAFQFDAGDYDSATGRYIWKNNYWSENKLININTIIGVQNDLNNYLKAQGYVYLNDALKALGQKPVKNGYDIGWVLGSDGDNFIDFGVLPGKYQIPINRLFMDEKNAFNTPIIDLNVDGGIKYIYDDICEYDNHSNLVGDKRKKLRCLGGR